MFIDKLIANNSSEFPGFRFVGYSEIAIPMFRRILKCMLISKERMAAVDEFVLRYSILDIPLKTVSMLMGLDFELIEQSWFNLLSKDIIDKNSKLTEQGREYLNTFKLDTYQPYDMNILINGITGHIEVNDFPTMSGKNLREAGLKSLNNLIESPDINNIDVRKVKIILKKSSKFKNEEEESEIMGISEVIDKGVVYKRLNLLIFSDDDKNARFMIFDGWERVAELEDHIIELEQRNCKVLKTNINSFMESYELRLIYELKEYCNPKTQVPIEELNITWNNMMDEAKKSIIISIPLIETIKLNDDFIARLYECVSRGIKVQLFLTGREIKSNFQKKQYEDLIKKKKIEVYNYPYYDSRFILVDSKFSLVTDYEKNVLNLPLSKETYLEYGVKILEEDALELINKKIDKYIKKCYLAPISFDRNWICEKMKEIISLSYEFDSLLQQKNSVGWIGADAIPNVQKMVDFPVAETESQYREFLNYLNQSFVENAESTWNSKGLRKYFWNEFQLEYPELQHVLHKIKLYRHSTHHIELQPDYKTKYFKFLDEDVAGSNPSFIENGYRIIQYKLINSLHECLVNACKK